MDPETFEEQHDEELMRAVDAEAEIPDEDALDQQFDDVEFEDAPSDASRLTEASSETE